MKIFVKTFGCVFNHKDSENIKGVLSSQDFEIVNTEDKADIIIVNSCGVKDQTQSKIIFYIESLDKPVYLGGCLPKILDLKKIKNVKGVFDPNTINNLPNQINGEIEESFSSKKLNKLKLPSIQENENTLIVPISEGCLGNCNYCGTKFARGKLKSYPINEIVDTIRGFKGERVNLTSQDNSCYGFDIGTNLANLLKELIKLEGDYLIRVGMMNPEHILKILPEFVEVFKNKRFMRFLHIPIQSGSNKVLKEMNRNYTVEQFKELVNTLRREIPDIHIATDIIIGYPTETEEDFLESKKLLDEMKFEVLNLSKYTARPGTYSKKFLKPLKSEIVKERSIIFDKYIKK